MAEPDTTNAEGKLQDKGEFVDAVRRHICQVLGFDFGLIDIARGHEIVNIASFSAEDASEEDVKKFVDTLIDEHKQPLTVANTLVAQKVKQTERPWIGKVSPKDATDNGEKEEYPYVIMPVFDNPVSGTGQIKGLIRVVSFDTSREIDSQDLSTLKLMGEHLASRAPLFVEAQGSETTPAEVERIDDNVLIVHSNRPIRRRFSRILGQNYNVLESDSGERAIEIMRNTRVDLVIVDSAMEGTSGFGLCKVIKDSPEWKHIPVILVTGENNPSARVEALNVGADDCLADTCFDSELLARVRSSLRHRKAERELAVQLELLEDYAQRLESASEQLKQDKKTQLESYTQLKQLKWESDLLRNQEQLLHRISSTIRQSFNISQNLNEMLEMLSGWFRLDCAFVVLPSDTEPEDSIRCEYATDEDYRVIPYGKDLKTLEIFQRYFQPEQVLTINDVANDKRLEPFRYDVLGGYNIISLFYVPIHYEQKLLGLLVGYKCETQANWTRDNETFMKSVADQVASGVTNARLYARVQRQATTDGLTGLFNHRTGQEKLAEQLRLAERYQRNVAVVMLDVDHFKSINDNYGHPAGDSVLKSVAKLIKSDCRDVDLPVRYGGEEFLLVLPEVNQEGAVVVAERIRRTLSQEVIFHESLEITVTASIGVASFPEDASSQQQLLDLADKALYLSKRLGRNQVHTASDLMFEEVQREQEHAQAQQAEGQLVQDPNSVQQQYHLPTVSKEVEEKEELVPEVVEMVKALASALYSKSEYNKDHHLETARLSELLAKVMGLSQQQVEQIRVAGLLHDVGTLSLPSDLLNKVGPYTEEERALINQHPVLGANLLRPIRALRDICEILENHHERWDGTGYPRGLKGEEIPLPARIVSIVDSYHAMLCDRPYRPAMSQEQALSTLRAGAGRQWDPFLVDIFVAVITNSGKP